MMNTLPLDLIKFPLFATDQQDGKYEESLKLAKRVLKTVKNTPEDELQNKQEILANLHSQMGNAYLEMGKYSLALDHHNQDRDIAQEQ